MKAAQCDHQLKNDSGTITTPNYPQNYPASLSCVWTISAPEGYYIQLKFLDFDVEPYEDCKTDFLEIKDGGTKNSPLIGNFRNSVKMVCFQLMDHRQISLLMLGHFFAMLHFYTP